MWGVIVAFIKSNSLNIIRRSKITSFQLNVSDKNAVVIG